MPETPEKTSGKLDDPESGAHSGSRDHQAQLLETPFTKAKRKAVPRDITNDQINDDYNDLNLYANEGSHQHLTALDDPFTSPNQHLERTGKAPRTSTSTTPGQHFAERLKNYTISSPTPKSRDHKSPSETMASEPQQRETSPTPARFNDSGILNPEEESDLAAKVLDLVRADFPNLKASTELEIRHEIGLALDMGETKLRRYEVTIRELMKRVDELETMVWNLT